MSQTTIDAVEELLTRLGAALLGGRRREFEEKAPRDLVTELDRRLEDEIRRALPRLQKGSVVVGEEAGGEAAEWTWWVDPIDGTTNFVHGWPRSALSVALLNHDRPALAVVHDPYRGETFRAEAGNGAWLGGRPIRVSGCSDLSRALLCTGFAPEPASQWELCRRLQSKCHGLRVSGCASLDFAYVACGRCDGFWEVDLKAWDVAAGLLLVREAGGAVADFLGNEAHLYSQNFVVATKDLMPPLLREIREAGLQENR